MNITLNTDSALGMTGSSAAGKLSGVSKTENAQKTAEAQTNSESLVIKASSFDRVELSDEAKQYLSEESEDTAETETAELSDMVSKTASEDTDDVLASELYSYTETELQELMLNGTITRAEYEAELEKRSGEDVVTNE